MRALAQGKSTTVRRFRSREVWTRVVGCTAALTQERRGLIVGFLAGRAAPAKIQQTEGLLFRIRRIHDDLLSANRAALEKVQELLRTQFPELSE